MRPCAIPGRARNRDITLWVNNRMARKMDGQKGFLSRLLHNEAGNVLFMTAAFLIPLLGLVGEQVLQLREDLRQLYDDQFIETCAEWVVPYIGDLLGHEPRHGTIPRIASPRAEVTRTVGYDGFGRVASLDFFISIAFMPLSIALTGLLSRHIDAHSLFIAAGLAPLVAAAVLAALGQLRTPSALPAQEEGQ